jgi:hypothetical protein
VLKIGSELVFHNYLLIIYRKIIFLGNAKMLVWKTIEKLIEEDVFKDVRKASPFYLGYQFHSDDGSDEIVVLRILF